MSRILTLVVFALALCGWTSCGPVTPPPVPPGLGGATGSGGATTTGGTATGGASVATGGASAGAAGQAQVAWVPDIECSTAIKAPSKVEIEQYRRTLMPRRGAAQHRRARASYTIGDYPNAGWEPLGPTLDQRRGSCTANAALHDLTSKPWTWTGALDPEKLQDLADDIYSEATRRDAWDGAWPPDDTGSDSGTVMAVLRDRGLITSWSTIVTFEGLQAALQEGPCSMDSDWWSSMYTPDKCGNLEIAGTIDGGHATKATAVDYSTKRFLFLNSWGDGWGAKRRSNKQGGFFWLTFGRVKRLIDDGATFYCPKARR